MPPAVPGKVYVSTVEASMPYESSSTRRRALLATEEQVAQFKAATLAWLSDLDPAPTEADISVRDDGFALKATVLVRGQVVMEDVVVKLSEGGFLEAVQSEFADED